jgi:excisionase family DNA binding protein
MGDGLDWRQHNVPRSTERASTLRAQYVYANKQIKERDAEISELKLKIDNLENGIECTTDELLTRKDAADLLRVTQRTILTWEKEGKMPKAKRLGGVLRFSKNEIIEWVKQA